MTDWLDAILIWAALKLPEAKAGWVTDLRHEARHVPSDMRRAQFLFSGVLAALGQLLRIHVGPRRVGQGLIGLALLGLCFSVGMAALATDDRTVQTTFFSVLPLYGIACALVVLNLRWMRRLYGLLRPLACRGFADIRSTDVSNRGNSNKVSARSHL